jgi:uncharacterized protein with ParB-like and HNH nuclease domain
MRVTQEPINITDVLKDKFFRIPVFQREYSWNLEQVSDLYYDIFETQENESHFLGSLLLYKEANNKTMEVIDGQQRLTTIFLLLFSIIEEIKDSSSFASASEKLKSLIFTADPNDLLGQNFSLEPRLETSKRDKQLFKSILKGEDYSIHKDGRRNSHKNLTNALDFFTSKIKEIREKDDLEGVLEFAQKIIKSKFIIMTAEKQSDKILLFKTVNARGLELTQGDLIKNELCRFISDNDLDEMIQIWDDVRELIEDNKGKLDTFLFHHINSLDYIQNERKELDKKRKIKNWDKKNYPPVPEKYLFDMYCRVIERESPETFLKTLKSSSKDYVELINPSNNQVYLSSLKAMGVNKCFPLLLDVKNKFDKKEFENFTHLIDSLSFRHSVLRKDPKELEKFYYQLSDFISKKEHYSESVNKIKKHLNFKEEVKFKDEFIVLRPKMSVSKMILDRIVRLSSESVDWSNRDTHIEHIMPQKPAGEWLTHYDDDIEKYKDYINRVGNLTILQDKKNIRARNKDFIDKIKYYSESRISITKNLGDYKNWDFSQIEKRQADLYELSKDIWNCKKVN